MIYIIKKEKKLKYQEIKGRMEEGTFKCNKYYY